MHLNKEKRMRRIRKARMQMRRRGDIRLVVHRTPCHTYAQIIQAQEVLVSASTLDSDLRGGATGNKDAAVKVGALIAKRAQAAGIQKVSFDRSGFKYHGRVKALAETARAAGLSF